MIVLPLSRASARPVSGRGGIVACPSPPFALRRHADACPADRYGRLAQNFAGAPPRFSLFMSQWRWANKPTNPLPVQTLIISDDTLGSLRGIAGERPHILQTVILCGRAGGDLIRARRARPVKSGKSAIDCERLRAGGDGQKQGRKKQAHGRHQDPPEYAGERGRVNTPSRRGGDASAELRSRSAQ